MKPSKCLALVLASGLAIGCAAAGAQDQGGPPPGPPPQEGLEPGQRPPLAEEAKRHLAERIRQAEEKIAQIEQDPNRPAEAGPTVEGLHRHVEMMRERLAQLDRGEMPGPMGRGGPQGPGGPQGRGGPQVPGAEAGPMGRGGPGMGGRGMGEGMRGPMGGPGPSVEQRLEMLERAFREMHAMFERHMVPPEARERAERAMQERREGPPPDGRPGEGRGPRELGEERRPEAGEPGRPGQPPHPPNAAPEVEELKRALMNQQAEMKQALEHTRIELETTRHELGAAREALKKAQAEIEELRAKK
jgi:hypothetical protein